jgi:hypothetical protein
MHFEHLDLGVLGVMLQLTALGISIEMHLAESVSIITLTDGSPNDGARTWS